MKNQEPELDAPELSFEEWTEGLIQRVRRYNRRALRRWAKDHPGEPFPLERKGEPMKSPEQESPADEERMDDPTVAGGPDVELSLMPLGILLRDGHEPCFLYARSDLRQRTILGLTPDGPFSTCLPDVLSKEVHEIRRKKRPVTWVQLRGAPVTDALRRCAKHLGVRITEAPDPSAGEA